MTDYHISPTGNDSANGLTAGTAWRTLGKAAAAAAGSKVILYGGGVIANGATSFQKALAFTTPPNVHAQIKGSGKISVDIQNWVGGSILPGAGGSITVLPPSGFTETTGSDGEKAGAVTGRGLSINKCADMNVNVIVKAGTDYGIYVRDTVRSRIWGDVSDAGEAFHLHGNLGTGTDRTWVGGYAHDCFRMVRNTKAIASDDYGALGFSVLNSTGGGILAGSKAERCYAPSFDYVSDGGGIALHNSTDLIVDWLECVDCEGGFEDGGSAGAGNKRNNIKMRITGNQGIGTEVLGKPARSPGVLIRNNSDGVFEFYLDMTRARVAFEMYADTGQFAGSIERTKVTGTLIQRPGVTPTRITGLPASSSVTFAGAPPPPVDPCLAIKAERDAAISQRDAAIAATDTALGQLATANSALAAANGKIAAAKAALG